LILSLRLYCSIKISDITAKRTGAGKAFADTLSYFLIKKVANNDWLLFCF
jgi:hypothetical protein